MSEFDYFALTIHRTMPLEIKRIFDFAYFQLEEYDLKKAMVSKSSGEWVPTSSREFIEKANMASCGLLALGVKPGDRVALISSTNRTEWNIMDQAILQIGAVNVPIYPTISKEDYERFRAAYKKRAVEILKEIDRLDE